MRACQRDNEKPFESLSVEDALRVGLRFVLAVDGELLCHFKETLHKSSLQGVLSQTAIPLANQGRALKWPRSFSFFYTRSYHDVSVASSPVYYGTDWPGKDA